MKKYPRVVDYRKKAVGGKCYVCGIDGADETAYVQINSFRGDDDVYILHSNCAGKWHDNLLAKRAENIKKLHA